jgi:D-ribose pyranase
MKKSGILNPQLARIIASMGHTDRLVVCDSGLPIPRGAEVVNLALAKNIPRFLETVRVLMEEMEVDRAVVASELRTQGNGMYEQLRALLPRVEMCEVSHEQFKTLSCEGRTIAFVRTGEATPFANVILESGVTFN